ncbi:MAG: EAL domain-containing protein [Lautropia sp.]
MSIQARHQLPGLSRGGHSDDRSTAILREAAGDFCALLSRDGRLSRISGRGLAFLGCEGQGAIELRLPDLVVAAEHERLAAACRRCFDDGEDVSMQLEVLRSLLDPVRVALSLHRIAPDAVLVLWRDVALVSGLRAALRQSRDSDALTGLAQRDAFAAMVLAAARDADDPSARRLLVIDFVGWPSLRRALGRAASDAAIAQLARRLDTVLRGFEPLTYSLRVARLQEARMATMFDADGETLEAVLAALQQRLAEAVATDFMSFVPRPRIIVVLLDRIDADRIEGVDPLERAESALEVRMAHVDATPVQVKLSEFALMSGPVLCRALTGAFINGEFDLAWQPVFAVARPVEGAAPGRLGPASMHAFRIELRWVHDGMQVPTTDFVPIAAASGLLGQLSTWAMRVVGATLSQWAQAGTKVRCIAPMTAAQFAQDDLVPSLGAALDRFALPRDDLYIEVDARTLAADPAFAERRLGELRDAGFRMAACGIGAPGGSITDLARWPLALALLDPGCFARAADDEAAGRVAVALLRLLAALGVEVVATGIDDEAQWQWLLAQGAGGEWTCLAAGDALGAAMPAAQAGEWLMPAPAPARAEVAPA